MAGYSGVKAIATFAGAVVLVVSAFFIPGVFDAQAQLSIVKTQWLSSALAITLMLLVAVFLAYVNSDRLQYSSDSMLLYGYFLLIVFSFPSSIILTEYHLAVLLLLFAIYSMMRYVNEEGSKVTCAFYSGLSVSAASVLVPPMIWVLVYFFLSGIFKRGKDSFRFCLAFLSAALLPWIYILSWKYIFAPETAMDYVKGFFGNLVPERLRFRDVSTVSVVYAGLCVFVALRSVIFVLARRVEKNREQKYAFGFSAALSLVLVIIYCLYSMSLSPLYGMVCALASSFCVYAFLTGGNRFESSLYVFLLVVCAMLSRLFQMNVI